MYYYQSQISIANSANMMANRDAYRTAIQMRFPVEDTMMRINVHYSIYKRAKAQMPNNIWSINGSYDATTKHIDIKITADAEETIRKFIAEEKRNTEILKGQISIFDNLPF